MKTEQILAQQQERIARSTEFSIEALKGTFEGYTLDDRWNGWACPYFELETAKKLVALYNEMSIEYDQESLLYWDGEKIMEKYDDSNRSEGPGS